MLSQNLCRMITGGPQRLRPTEPVVCPGLCRNTPTPRAKPGSTAGRSRTFALGDLFLAGRPAPTSSRSRTQSLIPAGDDTRGALGRSACPGIFGPPESFYNRCAAPNPWIPMKSGPQSASPDSRFGGGGPGEASLGLPSVAT